MTDVEQCIADLKGIKETIVQGQPRTEVALNRKIIDAFILLLERIK